MGNLEGMGEHREGKGIAEEGMGKIKGDLKKGAKRRERKGKGREEKKHKLLATY